MKRRALIIGGGAWIAGILTESVFAQTKKQPLVVGVLTSGSTGAADSRQWVQDGALLSYGADNAAQFRRAAYYVDRILRGAKPAELPIELPKTFQMAVILKTARALGLTLPPEIMVQANVVME